MKGRFINSGLHGQAKGYTETVHHYEPGLVLRFRQTAIKEFELNPDHPLTYQAENGEFWQPGKKFLTDWGSIPVPVQTLLAPDDCLGYPFHDFGYGYGGLWYSHGGLRWDFARLDRVDVDNLLLVMIAAQWGMAKARVVWAAVRLFGWTCWHPKRQARKREQWRRMERTVSHGRPE